MYILISFVNGRFESAIFTDPGQDVDFSLFGVSVDIQTVELVAVRPQGNEPWDPQLEVQGAVVLPSEFGSAEIQIKLRIALF